MRFLYIFFTVVAILSVLVIFSEIIAEFVTGIDNFIFPGLGVVVSGEFIVLFCVVVSAISTLLATFFRRRITKRP